MKFLSKNQTKNKFPKVFNDDGSMIADRVNIANTFNVFFTNIGEKIAKGINYDGNKNYGNYLNKEIHSSFTNIDEAAMNKIIYNLAPKSSSEFISRYNGKWASLRFSALNDMIVLFLLLNFSVTDSVSSHCEQRNHFRVVSLII